MPYVASRSPLTFSNERGLGAFAPLNVLPKRSNVKQSLFHIPNDDDDDDGQNEHSPPRSPPRNFPSALPSHPPIDPPPSVPFPTVSPASPTSLTAPNPTSAPIQRTPSSTSIMLANGRPLKSSLKSASSSSITDDLAASASRHARAQSMPSTPPDGPKNVHVHFKEKEDGLESIRVFRRTGKPVSVSKPTSDTETETEPEPSAFPFPHVSSNRFGTPGSSSLSEIFNCSAIPPPNPCPYANVHIESITLPPARPPVLRGTALVRNIVFEKHVNVRFTLDDWTTVSEVLATYSGPVVPTETLAGINQTHTVGDLIGSSVASGWDRFNFAIRLEDYETYLWQRTLFLVVRYSAPGVGEFWDNNSGENYRIRFRPYTGPMQPERKRGTSAPSIAPFLLSSPSSPLTSRIASHDEPRPTFSPPPRPLSMPRSASSPISIQSTIGHRLNLRHYVAPTPPRNPIPVGLPFPKPASSVPCEQSISTPPETPTLEKGPTHDKDEVDEGFATGSEDSDVTETRPSPRPQLSVKITSSSVIVREVSPVSPTPSPPPRQAGPFSPIREPFSPRSGGSDDSTYATLIREWCFAEGSDSFSAGGTIGAQSAVPWVGGLC